MPFVRLCPLSELWVGELRHAHINGHDIVVLRTDGRVAAFEDKCPHLGFALSQGRLENGTLTCAAHEWQFDAECGAGINPAESQLKAYPVEIRDEEIWIEVTPA